jgi:hypothetical protein
MELKMVRRLSGFGGMLAGLVMQSAVARAGEVIGWMDVRPADGKIEIAGHAYSAARVAVDYTLKVDRAGPSGRTSTSQRGRAEIEPGEVARLSTTSVNLGGKGRVDRRPDAVEQRPHARHQRNPSRWPLNGSSAGATATALDVRYQSGVMRAML